MSGRIILSNHIMRSFFSEENMIPIQARFWKQVNFSGSQVKHVKLNGRCWEWLGYISSWGYGQIKINGKMQKAHRASFAFENKIPNGMLVLHKCDNPKCVRPSHLFLGTNRDNMRDMISKGRDRSICATHRGKTHCKRGHEFTKENTRKVNGGRCCKICQNYLRKRWRKNRRKDGKPS